MANYKTGTKYIQQKSHEGTQTTQHNKQKELDLYWTLHLN
jgi:hypothetical protein